MLQAAGRPPGQQKPLQYDVSVTLKLIQVYVTDKNGRPVMDLTRDDFRVYDGGKQVVVTEFERHGFRSAVPMTDTRPEALAPPSPEIPSLKRKFILFFDFAFNTHKGVTAGVKAALDFLDTKVGPDDETALMSYSMLGGLKVHEFLTRDHDKVRKAVSQITARAVAGRADEVEQAYWAMVELEGRATKEMEMKRQDSLHQVQKYFRALTDLALALRLLQGQKNLLFFSGGVPSSLVQSRNLVGSDSTLSDVGTPRAGGAGGFSSRPQAGSRFEIGDPVLRQLMDTMLKEFSRANCSLFAFDTRESAKVPALFVYDEMAFDRRTGGMFSADNVGTTVTSPFRDEKTTGMDTLKFMAGSTGGRYFGNILFYERDLGEVVDLTGAYYVVGYRVPAASDGKYREVKVEVNRKGCIVRAQRGYYNPKPFREYTDLEKKLHLFDLALNGRSDINPPIEFPMTILCYVTSHGIQARVLARLPSEIWDVFQGQTAEIMPIFFEEQEDLVSLKRAVVPVAGQRGKTLFFTSATEARPGAMKCRLVIRDLDSGQSALATGSAYIRSPDATGFGLSSPLVLVPVGGATLLEAFTGERSEDGVWREIYAYNPLACTPLMADEPVMSDKLLLIVPVQVKEDAGDDLGLKLALVDTATGEGRDVPFAVVRRVRAAGHEVLFLEMATDFITTGKYLLYINAGLRSVGSRSSVHVPLSVNRQ